MNDPILPTWAPSFTAVLGVDPGASGGIALTVGGDVSSWPMPPTEGDVVELLRSIETRHPNARMVAYVEEVGGYVGSAQPGAAMFKFGRNFGFLLGVLQTRGWHLHLVRPQKWQKQFGLGTVTSSGGKTKWKQKLKAEAQRLFPGQKVTLKTADALLILHYGRMHQQQQDVAKLAHAIVN